MNDPHQFTIKHIFVSNFKSLVDFHLPLAKFSCLIGLNSTGKSTVLQFFDFVSQQMHGDIDDWLKNRQWRASDINSKLIPKSNIDFEITLQNGDGAEIRWKASFNRQRLHCTTETISWNRQELLRVQKGQYSIWDVNQQKSLNHPRLSGGIYFDYQGSVLSQIKETGLNDELRALKTYFQQIKALDLLSPELLRRRSREANQNLGLGGEKLSSFLYELNKEQRASLRTKMVRAFPQFEQIEIISMRSGWKKLTIHERFNNLTLETEARHVADGFLRFLAIFAQLSEENSFLLLDEIENGVNLELIELLVDALVDAPQQVIVTTHSPVILNYLEDDIAQQGVVYLYKQKDGKTQAIRLFDIPSMRKKLTVMGPGEVYEDTILTELKTEIESA